MDKYQYNGLHLAHGRTTNLVMGTAYRVHSRLGPGLLERVYKSCVAYEFRKMGMRFEVERALPVRYDDEDIDIGFRVDFLVEDTVIVEVKAIEKLLPVHEAQLLSYLRLSGKQVGLVINFNVAHLRDGIRRKINGF